MKDISTLSFGNQVVFVGIDVHKKSWVVTERHCGRLLKTYSMTPSARELAERLRRQYPEAKYKSVYEAGFCGFWIHRQLLKEGIENIVINPADVPTSGKEKDCKNDTFDSKKLARELENGSLTPIYTPDESNLQLRQLVRRETQLTGNITRCKNRIQGHMHFTGHPFMGWSCRSLKTMENESEKRYDDALLSMFRELQFLRLEKLKVIQAEKECLLRLNRVGIQKNLTSIPGIGFRTAVVLQAELWDLKRFRNKDALCAYVGLAPRLVGSGEHENVRSAGNRKKKELHYILIESAWKSVAFDLEQRARYGSLINKGSSARAISIVAKRLLLRIRAVWEQNRNYIVAT